MTIAREGKARPTRVARTYRGVCHICWDDVVAGQAYEYAGGSNTQSHYLVHYNCYKPSGAPTYEELLKSKRVSNANAC